MGSSSWSNEDSARNSARNRYTGLGQGSGANNFEFHWRTRAKTGSGAPQLPVIRGTSRSEEQWIAAAEAAVIDACDDLGGGYKYKRGSADFGPGHNLEPGTGLNNVEDKGDFHGWFFAYETRVISSTTYYKAKARESRTWHGVCTKRVRR